ncbi:succinate dehydrogenase cytochrome b560 subunit, mitochondrial-like [Halichondria panicea]|uniref:succinate dehydrogenase cytochrome b560 subunit, mitochondrial-like n=1 Tax=Halichondria panicea TaxID=6063 RepID=UPI00312B90C4
MASLVRIGAKFPVMRSALRGTSLYRPIITAVACQNSEGYVSRNKKMGRPLSPSLKLLVDNPEPVWMLSIGHRASALILTPVIATTTMEYMISGKKFPEFLNSFEWLTSNAALWTSFKFMMAFPFAYHCFNGFRHLYWDSGRGFTIKFTKAAGFAVLGAALVSGLGLALYTPA